ncbi:MAG: hypothetical protein JKY20_01395 [Alphaproteobacteria bacterium]|nr:hypothetical protein [Alphaproteobacteria bacterium]
MSVDESDLSKGQLVKLKALRKSIGEKLGSEVFAKWMKEQSKAAPKETVDPVAEILLNALKSLEDDKSVKLGNWGYAIKRAKGHSAKGFQVTKITKA